jgi:hypothetical protein
MAEMQKQADVDSQDDESVARQWVDDHAGQIDNRVG